MATPERFQQKFSSCVSQSCVLCGQAYLSCQMCTMSPSPYPSNTVVILKMPAENLYLKKWILLRKKGREERKKEKKGKRDERGNERGGRRGEAEENRRERDLQMIEPVCRGFILLHQHNQHSFPCVQTTKTPWGSLFWCLCLSFFQQCDFFWENCLTGSVMPEVAVTSLQDGNDSLVLFKPPKRTVSWASSSQGPLLSQVFELGVDVQQSEPGVL